MKTMADVTQWIKTETPFSLAFEKKVLGSLRRIERLPKYGVSLCQVPADITTFDEAWGRGPVRALPAGFKDQGSFATWRSQVRSALTAFTGSTKPMMPILSHDDWDGLLSDLDGAGVPSKKRIAVLAGR